MFKIRKLLVLVAVTGLAAESGKSQKAENAKRYRGYSVVRVNPSSESELEKVLNIAKEFSGDTWSERRLVDGDCVDFLVPFENKTKINEGLQGITHEVLIEDVQALIDKQSRRTSTGGQLPKDEKTPSGEFDYERYHTFGEIEHWIKNFAATHKHVTHHLVGTGFSLQGNAMRAIKISAGPGRPAFVINCGIHAREWVSPASCLFTANELVTRYEKKDPIIGNLVNAVDFYIIPVSNPDGYIWTWRVDRLWRKTRSTPYMNDCSDCYGVDANRNFDNHWGEVGTSGDCCSILYKGPKPFSEIETQNQRDFVRGIRNVKAYIDIHAYSQLWMYPHGWTSEYPTDYELLDEIARASVKSIEAAFGKTYYYGTIANIIYEVSGSTADYFYEEEGIKCSFAAELRDTGYYGFLLPESEIYETATEAFVGMMAIADYIRKGRC